MNNKIKTGNIGDTGYVGKRLEDVGTTNYRVTKEDGNHFIVTQDFRPDRVNFEVEDGVIVRESRG